MGEKSERQEEKGCGNEEPGGVWGTQGRRRRWAPRGARHYGAPGAKNREPAGPGREGPAPGQVTHKGGRGRGPGRQRSGLSGGGPCGRAGRRSGSGADQRL